MRNAALIVAAGRGMRAGGGVPKQFRPLGGKPVLVRSISAFLTHPGIAHVMVVLHPDDRARFEADIRPALPGPVAVCDGGASRAQSVQLGLEALAGDAPDLVLIHDAARPLISEALIGDVLAATARTGAAAPALAVSDTLWRNRNGHVGDSIPRDGLCRAQTPQGFRFQVILAAHRAHGGAATDDVEVAHAAGQTISIVAGEDRNMKITEAADFARAERFLEDRMDIRTGQGFDVHAFTDGNHVTLCGVDVPHDKGLLGHSDADVAMHALSDAIYGGLAAGDIGRHFPPSDPRWKAAASEIFLAHAAGLAAEKGFRITHLDCTIICETPKIGPHAAEMQAEIARITGLSPDRVSVKATTSERLGFTGRGEGIAALATATLVTS